MKNVIIHLTKVQNVVSATSYYYDARGNVLSETQHINNTNYTLRYDYDKADNLTNIVYPSNNQVVYSYSNGQISKVTVNGKTVAEISHLPFGPIDQITYGNNVTEKISYNTMYMQTGYSLSNELLNREHKIANGNINAISGVGLFYYDEQARFTLFMSEDYRYMQFYYYDSLGNLTSFNEYGGDANTTYNTAPNSNRIISKISLNKDKEPIATINYSYDNAGNMIKSGTTNYIYNSLNQLQSVTIDDLKQNSKEIASYQYNAFSQRIMKTVNGNKTIFICNPINYTDPMGLDGNGASISMSGEYIGPYIGIGGTVSFNVGIYGDGSKYNWASTRTFGAFAKFGNHIYQFPHEQQQQFSSLHEPNGFAADFGITASYFHTNATCVQQTLGFSDNYNVGLPASGGIRLLSEFLPYVPTPAYQHSTSGNIHIDSYGISEGAGYGVSSFQTKTWQN